MWGVVRGAVIGADNYSTPLDNYSTSIISVPVGLLTLMVRMMAPFGYHTIWY